jgi:biopolymer transport protein ExbB/TolQ
MYFFKSMGNFLYPMMVICIANLVLIIRKIIDLYSGRDLSRFRLEKGLHAIIFWGVVSAVFGLLGQITGIYNALGAIVMAKEISPNVVAMGFAQSFTTTIFGLEILIVSALAWFILYARYKKLISAK